jgi:hypothetical protein
VTIITAPRPMRGYTRAALYDRARALHKPRVLLWNAAWWCVLAAILLSALGIAAIATTETSLALRHDPLSAGPHTVEMEVEGIGVLRNTIGPRAEAPGYRFKAPAGAFP